MERTIKSIKVGNHDIVIFEYLTGGEFKKLQVITTDGMTVNDLVMKKPMSAKSMLEARDLALKMLIVSFDGNTEGAYEKACDLSIKDFSTLMESIDLIIADTEETKKKEQES